MRWWCKKKWGLFVTVKAWDTFDFTEWWNPFDGSHNPLGAIANDFGHYLQNNFTITPFYWEVVFDIMLF